MRNGRVTRPKLRVSAKFGLACDDLDYIHETAIRLDFSRHGGAGIIADMIRRGGQDVLKGSGWKSV